MAPLVKAFRAEPGRFPIAVCLTGQHADLLQPISDYDLGIMQANQAMLQATRSLYVEAGA